MRFIRMILCWWRALMERQRLAMEWDYLEPLGERELFVVVDLLVCFNKSNLGLFNSACDLRYSRGGRVQLMYERINSPFVCSEEMMGYLDRAVGLRRLRKSGLLRGEFLDIGEFVDQLPWHWVKMDVERRLFMEMRNRKRRPRNEVFVEPFKLLGDLQ